MGKKSFRSRESTKEPRAVPVVLRKPWERERLEGLPINRQSVSVSLLSFSERARAARLSNISHLACFKPNWRLKRDNIIFPMKASEAWKQSKFLRLLRRRYRLTSIPVLPCLFLSVFNIPCPKKAMVKIIELAGCKMH